MDLNKLPSRIVYDRLGLVIHFFTKATVYMAINIVLDLLIFDYTFWESVAIAHGCAALVTYWDRFQYATRIIEAKKEDFDELL